MTPRIHFHPSVEPPAGLARFPAGALASLLEEEGISSEQAVHCVLTDDVELASLNERFRGRQGPTDVLAFPYDSDATDGIVGDVFVSLDRATGQAAEKGERVEREVWRLFVHGALHLAGHDHDSETTDREMSRTQEIWVDRVFPRESDTN
jgi:rRNA maturation RNase YbeY